MDLSTFLWASNLIKLERAYIQLKEVNKELKELKKPEVEITEEAIKTQYVKLGGLVLES